MDSHLIFSMSTSSRDIFAAFLPEVRLNTNQDGGCKRFCKGYKSRKRQLLMFDHLFFWTFCHLSENLMKTWVCLNRMKIQLRLYKCFEPFVYDLLMSLCRRPIQCREIFSQKYFRFSAVCILRLCPVCDSQAVFMIRY